MNINDFEIEPMEQDRNTYVEYVVEDHDLNSRYPLNSNVSIKGRRDFEGVIDRLEDGKIIVKIFNETYSVPPRDFDSIFFMHPREKSTWYEKLKRDRTS